MQNCTLTSRNLSSVRRLAAHCKFLYSENHEQVISINHSQPMQRKPRNIKWFLLIHQWLCGRKLHWSRTQTLELKGGLKSKLCEAPRETISLFSCFLLPCRCMLPAESNPLGWWPLSSRFVSYTHLIKPPNFQILARSQGVMWTVSGLLHGEILPVCQQRGWKVNDESDIRTAAGEVILDNAYLWLKRHDLLYPKGWVTAAKSQADLSFIRKWGNSYEE